MSEVNLHKKISVIVIVLATTYFYNAAQREIIENNILGSVGTN